MHEVKGIIQIQLRTKRIAGSGEERRNTARIESPQPKKIKRDIKTDTSPKEARQPSHFAKEKMRKSVKSMHMGNDKVL